MYVDIRLTKNIFLNIQHGHCPEEADCSTHLSYGTNQPSVSLK
jgi:hypothetical protein